MVTLDRPRDSDVHTLCDFAEMLCLLTQDRICSRETLHDYIHDEGAGRVSEAELEDCFTNLQWRQIAFGASYPFALAANARSFSAPEHLSDQQRLYCFLLLCSGLPFTERPYNGLTDAFERVSLVALRAASPVGSNVRAFGKNETEYAGSKWERINTLGSEIGGEGRCTEHTFRERDSGDGGIDLVAWLPLDDHERRNIPSALAQCACSRSEWSAKQSEISDNRLGNLIAPTHRWLQALFIPHCFRDSTGKWAVPGDVGQTVLFDRLRIVKQIGPHVDWATINAPQGLADFLAQRLALV